MTYDEVCDLLAIAAAYDRRTLGDADGEAWEAAVGDLPFTDARLAVVAHYRASRDWIMPADVRQRVAAIQAERLRLAPGLEAGIPEELADRPIEYRDALQRAKQAAAEGQAPPRAIGGAQ